MFNVCTCIYALSAIRIIVKQKPVLGSIPINIRFRQIPCCLQSSLVTHCAIFASQASDLAHEDDILHIPFYPNNICKARYP